MKKLLLSLGIIGAFAGGIIFGVVYKAAVNNSQDSVAQASAAPDTYRPSQEMVYLANKIGLSTDYLNKTHAQFGIDQGKFCDPAVFIACYNPNEKTVRLYIKVFTKTDEDPATTLGYEVSHYVWQSMPDSEKEAIKPAMNNWYLAHKSQVDSTQSGLIKAEGGFGSDNFEDELHSITCTEVADNELAPELLAHCSAFLPNRSALRNIY